MSWFDSSFSFAKTALNQAQKSIDKVLDIKEGEESSQAILDPVNNVVVSTSASVSPPSTTSSETAPSITTHSTPDPPAKSMNPLSTWFSPSQQAEQGRKSNKTQDNTSTPVAEKSSFGSTWGAGDSFWGSYFGSPSTTDQGGGGSMVKSSGEGRKEAPKSTSMARGVGARKSKSQATSSNKTQSGEQREKVTSPRLTSPPRSSSTPLPQSKEKEKSIATESTIVVSSSTLDSGTTIKNSSAMDSGASSSSRPRQTATPKSSLKSQSTGKALVKASDGEEASSSESDAKVKAKKPSNQNLKSKATPDLSEPVKDSKDVVMEATDDGSKALENNALPVVEQTASTQKETNKQPNAGNPPLSVEDSKTNDAELTRKNSSPESQSSPTATVHSTVEKDTTQVPSQTENTDNHSVVHHETQNDSTNTQQVTIEYNPLTDQKLKTKPGTDLNSESKSTKQEKSGIPVKVHTENKEELDAKLTETQDSTTVHQIQTPGDQRPLEQEGDQNSSVVEVHGEEEREKRQPVVGGQEDDRRSTSTKEDTTVIEALQHSDIDRLKKELAEVRQVLEAREQKMIEMSRDSISLREANQSLEEELAEARRTGQTDVEELRSEFTRRLATAEKKFQAVVKERDSLRKQLQAVQDEQTQQKRSVGDEWSRIIKEKDEQIAQLMEEGEKLSKQELQSNSIIKKLRQKDKQNDQLLAAQRQQIEDLEGKVKILKEQVKKKEENEAKYQESLGQLNTIAEQQAKELASLKNERDELLDKVRSLQTNLDNSYKELAELQKANAVTQSAAQEAALTAEQSAREQLKGILEQQKIGAQREKEALLMQVDELRMSVSRAEQQAAWREDRMRQELADMQQRLQEAETRNQELTSSISQATKPLLRQIENLQAAHSAQSANWDKIEANLTQRLVQTQAQLSQSSEKERSAVEKEMTLQSRVRALETQLSGTKQEKSQLLATLELERAKLQTLEESQHRESAKTEALRTSYQQSMDELRKEKEMLERQLEYERVRLEAESRKACLESQEKERLRAQLASSLSLNHTVSRQSSSGSQSDILEKSLHAASEGGGSVSDMSLHTSRGGVAPSASLIEYLQSLLKQKEGELANSQNLVGSLERSRAAMAEDLANLSAQTETLKKEVEIIPPLKQKLQEVERKHEAMLQMYGEKAEEAEELKLDIDDLKTMYRQQIEELLSKRR